MLKYLAHWSTWCNLLLTFRVDVKLITVPHNANRWSTFVRLVSLGDEIIILLWCWKFFPHEFLSFMGNNNSNVPGVKIKCKWELFALSFLNLVSWSVGNRVFAFSTILWDQKGWTQGTPLVSMLRWLRRHWSSIFVSKAGHIAIRMTNLSGMLNDYQVVHLMTHTHEENLKLEWILLATYLICSLISINLCLCITDFASFLTSGNFTQVYM